MNWQPIETAPRDGTNILVLMEGVVIEASWQGSGYWVVSCVSSHGCGCCGSDNEEPTHWMPLPAAPKGEI